MYVLQIVDCVISLLQDLLNITSYIIVLYYIPSYDYPLIPPYFTDKIQLDRLKSCIIHVGVCITQVGFVMPDYFFGNHTIYL